MKKALNYLRLLRPKHCVKNFLILLPAFFGGCLFHAEMFLKLLPAFLSFSLFASAVYILNDLCDIEKDRAHPEKCRRPLASGAVGKAGAWVLFGITIVCAAVTGFIASGLSFALMIPAAYFVLNLLYSLKLKNVPLVDLVILVSGFFLRVLYGSFVSGVPISGWLYLAVVSLSFFLAIGKRRNEKRVCGDGTRGVLDRYNESFLNMNMYLYLALFIAFYAVWSMDGGELTLKTWTTPLVMVMMLRYSYIVEQSGCHGDPTSVILRDKVTVALGALYCAVMSAILYLPELSR